MKQTKTFDGSFHTTDEPKLSEIQILARLHNEAVLRWKKIAETTKGGEHIKSESERLSGDKMSINDGIRYLAKISASKEYEIDQKAISTCPKCKEKIDYLDYFQDIEEYSKFIIKDSDDVNYDLRNSESKDKMSYQCPICYEVLTDDEAEAIEILYPNHL